MLLVGLRQCSANLMLRRLNPMFRSRARGRAARDLALRNMLSIPGHLIEWFQALPGERRDKNPTNCRDSYVVPIRVRRVPLVNPFNCSLASLISYAFAYVEFSHFPNRIIRSLPQAEINRPELRLVVISASSRPQVASRNSVDWQELIHELQENQ